MTPRARFARMEDSTQEDWALIVPEAMKMARALPDRVLAHPQLLDGDFGGFPVRHHGIFQGCNFFHCIGLDRHLRDQFEGHPHCERTAEFVARMHGLGKINGSFGGMP